MVENILQKITGHGTNMKKTVLMCDPPSGWKYGFPKALPEDCIDNWRKQNEWMIKEGYPEKLIREFGDNFFIRYWREEVEINEN